MKTQVTKRPSRLPTALQPITSDVEKQQRFFHQIEEYNK